MKKRFSWILAIALVLSLAVCSFAAADDFTEFTMQQFHYKMWSSWQVVESEPTTHYFYEDSVNNPMVGYIAVQIQSVDASQAGAFDTLMDEMILGMIVSGMGDSLSVTFDTSMGTYGELTGMLFSGKWSSMSSDIVGFVCRDGRDFFFIMYADNNSSVEEMTRELTEVLLPEVTIEK